MLHSSEWYRAESACGKGPAMLANVTAVSSGVLFFPWSTFVIHFMVGMLCPTSLRDNSCVVLTASATLPRGPLHLFPFTVAVYFYRDTLTLCCPAFAVFSIPISSSSLQVPEQRSNLCSVTLHLCLLVKCMIDTKESVDVCLKTKP